MFKEIFNLKSILLYLSIFVLTSLASICLFALCLLLFEIDLGYATLFATISLAIGVFFTSYFLAKSTKEKGCLIGFALGLFVFIMTLIISLFADDFSLSLNTLFRFIIYILTGCCGGIISVNKVNRKKYF